MPNNDRSRAETADARARTLNNMLAQLAAVNYVLYAAAPTLAEAAPIDAALLDLVGPFQVFVEVVNKTLGKEKAKQ